MCVHRDMKHLGSLESTQEAGVALGYASSNSYASFVLSKLPDLDERTLTYEPLVKFSIAKLRQLIQLAFGVTRQQHYCNDLGLKLNLNLFRWPFVGLWTPIRSGVIEGDYIHRVTVTGDHFSKVPVTIQARRGPLCCSVFIPDGGFKGFGNETKKLSAKKRPNVLVRVPETVSVLLKFLISKTFERRSPWTAP